MKRTEWLQETMKLRFVEAYEGYRRGNLTQSEAALLLEVCDHTFRRYMNRYDEDGIDGIDGLLDKRLVQVSQRRAPVDEVMRMVSQYRSRHMVGTPSTFTPGTGKKMAVAATHGLKTGYKKLG